MSEADEGWVRRLSSLAFPAILALAAFLRLFGLQNGQYGSDDERLWAEALRSLAAHVLPFAGIRSSIGVANGPFQVYLVLPAAILTHAPLAGAIVVALVNVAGVLFLYRFVLDFFGRRPALIASLLFATNSWAIIFSRRMQGENMLVPFQILFFWSGARWLRRGRWQDLVLAFVWLAVMSQVYVLGLLHLASMGLILALGWRRLRPTHLLGGMAAFALLSFRYVLGALLPGIAGFRQVLTGHPRVDGGSLFLAVTMATHKGFQTIAGQAGSVFDATAGIEAVLVVLEGALAALGLAYVAWRLWRAATTHRQASGESALGLSTSRAGMLLGREEQSIHLWALLLIWTLLPIALFARHSVPLYPYYFVSIIPMPAILTGLLLDRFWHWGGPLALAVPVANSLALAGIFFAVIPGYYPRADYGLPDHETFDVAAQVRRLAVQRHVGRVYVDGDMDPSEVMGSVLGRSGLDVFWLDDYRTPEIAAPAAGQPPALYLTMADDTDTAHFLRAHFASQQALAVPLPGQGVVIRAYVLPGAAVRQAIEATLTQRLYVSAANGIVLQRFEGNRRLAPGGVLHAAVAWAWPGTRKPPRLHYSMFAHLIDRQGHPVAQADHPLQVSSGWRAGQVVVQWLDLPVPSTAAPGRYRLDLGVYRDKGTVRQALTDGAGKSIGSSLTLRPFVVPPRGVRAGAPLGTPEVHFADGIDLLSHTVSATPGGLKVRLNWAAYGGPSRDYTVFVHLLNRQGKLVAQADSQPRGGDFPTAVWRPGDRVTDDYLLKAPPGTYVLEAGLYYLPTLQRLPGGPLEVKDVRVSK